MAFIKFRVGNWLSSACLCVLMCVVIGSPTDRITSTCPDVATAPQVGQNSTQTDELPEDYRYDFANWVSPTYHVGDETIIVGVPHTQPDNGTLFVTMFGRPDQQVMQFKAQFAERQVELDWQIEDQIWSGNEQIIKAFPFVANEEFRLSIKLTASQFIFNVNGEPFGTLDYYRKDLLADLSGVFIWGENGMKVLVKKYELIKQNE